MGPYSLYSINQVLESPSIPNSFEKTLFTTLFRNQIFIVAANLICTHLVCSGWSSSASCQGCKEHLLKITFWSWILWIFRLSQTEVPIYSSHLGECLQNVLWTTKFCLTFHWRCGEWIMTVFPYLGELFCVHSHSLINQCIDMGHL